MLLNKTVSSTLKKSLSRDHAWYKLLAIPANISSLMHLKTSLIKSFKSNYSGMISDGHKHCLLTDCSFYFLPSISRDHSPCLPLRILQYTSILQNPHPWGQSSQAKAEQNPTYPHPFPVWGVLGLNIDRRII